MINLPLSSQSAVLGDLILIEDLIDVGSTWKIRPNYRIPIHYNRFAFYHGSTCVSSSCYKDDRSAAGDAKYAQHGNTLVTST